MASSGFQEKPPETYCDLAEYARGICKNLKAIQGYNEAVNIPVTKGETSFTKICENLSDVNDSIAKRIQNCLAVLIITLQSNEKKYQTKIAKLKNEPVNINLINQSSELRSPLLTKMDVSLSLFAVEEIILEASNVGHSVATAPSG